MNQQPARSKSSTTNSSSSQAAKRELVDTLFLNGHVSAPVLNEIAAVMDFAGDDARGHIGSTPNSKRKWTRIMDREARLPKLYYADVPFANGMRRHPFRLPSVKARDLWHQDKTYFQMSREQHQGRVETSNNWKNHPLFRNVGLKAVPVAFYGDGVPYQSGKYGKNKSLVCFFFLPTSLAARWIGTR
jgi:hypothetical protein